MRIVSIEPTPSPNVMKLNMDETLPDGVSYNFPREKAEEAPDYIRKLLAIDGVTSVFQVSDFLSLERHPKADWPAVLAEARKILGEAEGEREEQSGQTVEEESSSFGEITVLIQKLKEIPMQVKLLKDGEEYRFGLPDRFKEAVMKVQETTSNLIFERQWVEQKPRYGEIEEVGNQIVEEISAAYDKKRLENLVKRAFSGETETKEKGISREEVEKAFTSPEWEKRYAALEQFEPEIGDLDLLAKALKDEKPAIRRLAVVYLGFLEDERVLPYLEEALKDRSAIVRRTAGDTMSDLGNPKAIPAMCEALKDPNKLVRWRAARFLFEVGDESAIPALEEAVNDVEFEVRLQARMALERIKRGEEASGTVWQQMMRRMEEDKK
jgi:hypothetical protein